MRSSPCLTQTLFQLATGTRGPRNARWLPDDIEFPDWRFVPHRADLVRTKRDVHDRVRQVAVFEVQLRRDESKHASWPFYVSAARLRWRCPVTLVVVTLRRSVARWSRRPIRLDTAGSVLCPQVIGPDEIPVITSPRRAERCPELAVLSAAAHGRGPYGVEVARAALSCCFGLDRDRAALYSDFVIANLSEQAALAVRNLMLPDGWKPLSKIGRESYDKGFAAGLEESRLALAETILALLGERFSAVSPDVEQTVRAADLERLQRWGRRLLSATSADELLAT
ncbi:hypothetical protein [Haliangium sp.]